MIEHDGIADAVRGWAMRIGISHQAMHYRLKRHPACIALAARKRAAMARTKP
ncbi:MAG TPA: hypothetical protein VGH20_06425 [Myxococcales bacterium]|jgi:hypothetical protein